MEKRKNRRDQSVLLSLGAAIGAVVAFFADPRGGARRRALASDRTAGVLRRTMRRGGRRLRVTGSYAMGWSRRLRHLREMPKEYDDVTLAQKVQSEIFRPAGAPKGTVKVNVADGVVQLRGEVQQPSMIEDLVKRTRRVQGVRDVESFLHLPGTPAPMDH
jgi:hypothetical protein